MNLNPAQLEWIVREVVRRLQSPAAASPPTPTPAPTPTPTTTRLAITNRLVTTETLRNRLAGITQVDVISKAVVTPAVVDLLRERKIALVRAAAPQDSPR